MDITTNETILAISAFIWFCIGASACIFEKLEKTATNGKNKLYGKLCCVCAYLFVLIFICAVGYGGWELTSWSYGLLEECESWLNYLACCFGILLGAIVIVFMILMAISTTIGYFFKN